MRRFATCKQEAVMTALKRTAGRPPAPPTKPAMIRLTEAQRLKYLELGGARWVKRLIDEALNTPASTT